MNVHASDVDNFDYEGSVSFERVSQAKKWVFESSSSQFYEKERSKEDDFIFIPDNPRIAGLGGTSKRSSKGPKFITPIYKSELSIKLMSGDPMHLDFLFKPFKKREVKREEYFAPQPKITLGKPIHFQLTVRHDWVTIFLNGEPFILMEYR